MQITLIRHGKPSSATSSAVNAVDYLKWIRRYNLSDVSASSRPKQINKQLERHYLVSSDFNRAIHSTKIYTGRPPDTISRLYREMEIPRYKLPFKFAPMTWVYLCRILWMLGLTGPFESYRLAKRRADKAAQTLIELANKHGSLVLFGHGYMNLHIRRVLIKQGWLLHCKSNRYWGLSSLKSPKISITDYPQG